MCAAPAAGPATRRVRVRPKDSPRSRSAKAMLPLLLQDGPGGELDRVALGGAVRGGDGDAQPGAVGGGEDDARSGQRGVLACARREDGAQTDHGWRGGLEAGAACREVDAHRPGGQW